MPFWRRRKDEPVAVDSWTVDSPDVVPRSEGQVVAPITEPELPQGITVHDNGDISIRVSTVAEAKLAIKQLRLRKKELGLEKKQISTEMAEIKADRRQQVANQGPMMRGGGGFGKTVRAFQSSSRAAARAKHANQLAPYEDAKTHLDRLIMNVDNGIHQLEAYILQQSDPDE
jgi:hypothetical protein